ncbi:MAG: hypothetical protein QXF25_01915 [Candidatus Pacearchaeota archaeon]
MTKCYQKKVKLAKLNRRTKWAPFWIVLRKFGIGKKIHSSRLTKERRNWRGTKLKIKPRRVHKKFIG